MLPLSSLLLKNQIINKLQTRSLVLTRKLKESFTIQDKADFDTKVTQSKKPIIVDFHATWCGPCKILMPRLELAVGSTKDKVDLAKVDIDEHGEIAMEYGVQVVPTVIIFKNGKQVDKFTGLQDQDKLQKIVSTLLSN